MAGLNQLFTVTAKLQQGIVFDKKYGLTLDGLLSSAIREEVLREVACKREEVLTGSLLDGGLEAATPQEWDLPLRKCVIRDDDWHWLCSGGFLEEDPTEPPSVHRLTLYPDEVRGNSTMLTIPAHFGLYRGRFKTRITPVLSIVASSIQWRAVGDMVKVKSLLENIESIGGRRGSGEGRVMEWVFVECGEEVDEFSFGHTHRDGSLGRPVPIPCAEKLEGVEWGISIAGIRPPVFHPERQRRLAVPCGS